ncbi:MAG: phosphate-starvation-inducible PsiE family protein [Nitrospira sp. BO4]|jgi:uncharacterized membrane protein (DUF373 family)|nr:phosphate-starvation-inducible PsiE family protein [Nitrospira sp. BO4]
MSSSTFWNTPGQILLAGGATAWDRLRRLDPMEVWTWGIKGVLSLMMITILTALTGGILKTFLDLLTLTHQPTEVVLRQVIINTLILLAIVEVFKTTLTYFSEGRVKVTFIVDTILVVMLTEVISEWFRGGDWRALVALGGILLTLGTIRVIVVRWSPTQAGRPVYAPITHGDGGGHT